MKADLQFDKLWAFTRIGTPIGVQLAQDTQFYLHFLEHDVEIRMNPDEFVDFKWLTLDDALEQYKQQSLPLFVPQMHILTTLHLQSLSLSQLRARAQSWQKDPHSYLTNKGLFVTLNSIEDPKARQK